jgi:hypothetical protein
VRFPRERLTPTRQPSMDFFICAACDGGIGVTTFSWIFILVVRVVGVDDDDDGNRSAGTRQDFHFAQTTRFEDLPRRDFSSHSHSSPSIEAVAEGAQSPLNSSNYKSIFVTCHIYFKVYSTDLELAFTSESSLLGFRSPSTSLVARDTDGSVRPRAGSPL